MISKKEYNEQLREYKNRRKQLHEIQHQENLDLRNMHPDSLAVDYFANMMKEKLQEKRNEGRHGWEDPAECSVGYLSALLKKQIEEGNALNAANFCMMIYMRGEGNIR